MDPKQMALLLMQQQGQQNEQYTKPGPWNYNTDLGPQEGQFRDWVKQNQVPFDPNAGVSDYDMRGFYKGLQSFDPHATQGIDPNDQRMHYTDYYKTPFHQTFSNQSQWAQPNAPRWNDQDQLVDQNGNVIFNDRKF